MNNAKIKKNTTKNMKNTYPRFALYTYQMIATSLSSCLNFDVWMVEWKNWFTKAVLLDVVEVKLKWSSAESEGKK